ncbi:hypothetical protein L484_016940 [Morus notabilis]|uniref:Uncharacterized protein n=1 Tax=Morus notabilis TaxID=981085 RepID=W9QFT6_9ROSA|nr:hypothetical protein L484_016940 [Morus notabilis]
MAVVSELKNKPGDENADYAGRESSRRKREFTVRERRSTRRVRNQNTVEVHRSYSSRWERMNSKMGE